jgi:DNA-directed RNA polymerase subunit RPC12/RpoP
MDKKDFEAKLLKEFPFLYADIYGSPQETSMSFGLEIGPGWYDIVYRLSQTLERLIMLEPEEERTNYRMAQCKEKFGTLRVYMEGCTEEMAMAVHKAEADSAITCEDCGAPGKRKNGGWIRTLCDDCSDKWDKKRKL